MPCRSPSTAAAGRLATVVALLVTLSAAAGARGAVLRVASSASPAVRQSRATAVARTEPPVAVGFTSATLQGAVGRHRRPVAVRLLYGTTRAYGARTALRRVRASRRSLLLRWRIGSLRPGTVYHARLVVRCACPGSVRRGSDIPFATMPIGYENPVFGLLADPMALAPGGPSPDYYSYGTGDGFPIARSRDLVHWQSAGTALAARPSWVTRSPDWHPWGPSVARVAQPCPGATSPGCYHLFYVGLNASIQPRANCIGVATATTPGGPFTDHGILQTAPPTVDTQQRPVGCGDGAGYGNIDPAPFTDVDGRKYLYTSTDYACAPPTGSGCRLQPTLSVIPLTPDGLHALSPRQALLTGQPGSWEQAGRGTPVVENPTVERHGSAYALLYSRGDWNGPYGMGYAVAASPTGPFARGQPSPLLAQTASVLGPGGGSTVIGPHGGEWLVYHARAPGDGTRTLRIDPLLASADGGLQVRGPTSTPQSTAP